jgi:hypothetical protein
MGKDAADMEPRFVPPEYLMPRDTSGGIGFDSYNGTFGDGGRVTKPKPYFNVPGGTQPPKD